MQGEGPYDHEGGASEEQEGFDLRSALAILRRRRAVILLVALPLLIPASLLPFVLPKSYEATATVEFEKRAPVLEIGPDVMADGVSDRSGAALEASVVTLVTSEAVLGRVLDAMPPGSEGTGRCSAGEEAREEAVGGRDSDPGTEAPDAVSM